MQNSGFGNAGVLRDRGWKRRFEDPIPLPRGTQHQSASHRNVPRPALGLWSNENRPSALLHTGGGMFGARGFTGGKGVQNVAEGKPAKWKLKEAAD
jgi:hypothetical protein